jgi:hypothetical protein
MKASFKEFIQSGRFGYIQLNMSEEEVQALIGPPPSGNIGSRKYKRPSIWKYGDLELRFHERRIWLIHFEFLPAQREKLEFLAPISLEGWTFKPGMRRSEIEHILQCEGVEFIINPELTWDTQICLFVGPMGVKIVCGEDETVDSLSLSEGGTKVRP